ncbi:MAG: hypothetical protein AAF447_07710 [Myxococcota bacterium]
MSHERDEHGAPEERSERAPAAGAPAPDPLPLDTPRRRRRPQNRVTMEFGGPPLRLPEDPAVPDRAGLGLPEEAPAPLELVMLDETTDTGALGLVDRTRPSEPALDLASEMRERFALDDFTGALRAAELVLGRRPEDAEARRIAAESRSQLVHLYGSRLGGPGARLELCVDESEIRWLGLDHRAAFLLSRIDGKSRVEELIDVSGMPRMEALKTLCELTDMGALRIA